MLHLALIVVPVMLLAMPMPTAMALDNVSSMRAMEAPVLVTASVLVDTAKTAFAAQQVTVVPTAMTVVTWTSHPNVTLRLAAKVTELTVSVVRTFNVQHKAPMTIALAWDSLQTTVVPMLVFRATLVQTNRQTKRVCVRRAALAMEIVIAQRIAQLALVSRTLALVVFAPYKAIAAVA